MIKSLTDRRLQISAIASPNLDPMAKASTYVEWPVDDALRRHVACTWQGYVAPTGPGYTDRVIPDGCTDIIYDGSTIYVAGPDSTWHSLPHQTGATFVGLRFNPGGLRPFLDMPLSELTDFRVSIDD